MGSEIVVYVNFDGAVEVGKEQATATVLGVLVAGVEVEIAEGMGVVAGG